MLVEFRELFGSLGGVDNEFVVIPSGSNIGPIITPLEPTNLLPMRLVILHQIGLPTIPDQHCAIPSPTRQHRPIRIPIQAAHSASVPTQRLNFLLFGYVKKFDLADCIAKRYVIWIVSGEGNGTDVVGDVGGLVELHDLGGAAGPEVYGRLEAGDNVVVQRPI